MCDYVFGHYIKYHDGNASNIVDFRTETYKRENREFRLVIDFRNETFSYVLKKKDYKLESKLLSCSIVLARDITLKYKLDDEEMTILIQLL